MPTERTSSGFTRLADNPMVRVVAYYILLFAATGLLIQFVPGAEELFSGGLQPSVVDTPTGLPDLLNTQAPLFQTKAGLPAVGGVRHDRGLRAHAPGHLDLHNDPAAEGVPPVGGADAHHPADRRGRRRLHGQEQPGAGLQPGRHRRRGELPEYPAGHQGRGLHLPRAPASGWRRASSRCRSRRRSRSRSTSSS